LANLRDFDTSDSEPMDSLTKKCPRCRKEKPLDATEFKRTRDGFSTACLKCLDQIAQTAARTKKEKGNKENPAGSTDGRSDEEEDEFTLRNIHNLSEIDIESFLDTISATEDVHSFGALVNVSPIMKENLRECAEELVGLVWGRLKYRFMYISDSLMFYIRVIRISLDITVSTITKIHPHPDSCTTAPKARRVNTSRKREKMKPSKRGTRIAWIHLTAVDGFILP
jgi:hypothetical protein